MMLQFNFPAPQKQGFFINFLNFMIEIPLTGRIFSKKFDFLIKLSYCDKRGHLEHQFPKLTQRWRLSVPAEPKPKSSNFYFPGLNGLNKRGHKKYRIKTTAYHCLLGQRFRSGISCAQTSDSCFLIRSGEHGFKLFSFQDGIYFLKQCFCLEGFG